ncbi:Atxe2 family lasso peptide isopeptidase [Sphingomonas sp.]|uniref:Atxe2 family lasso peptide isopeptidase n=1 Tax=Sphingomonas sp. TaxID=28214 RepID=UPI000DB46D43|nr:Atxe2 family lasso peptide isopeptidase [Sphingomonas sp.]PZU07110.1 MAG: Atxe2 family lasso peptide isopeptidase [Sphingomonas sp.]
MRAHLKAAYQIRTASSHAVRICIAATFLLLAPSVRAESLRCSLLASAAKRTLGPINTDDLIRIRDFGGAGLGARSEPFALSPDGRSAALQLRQADPSSDTYCTAMVIVPITGSGTPSVFDDAGDIVAATSSRYGISGLPLGIPKQAIIRWSPDGRFLAYTKFFSDRSEIWIHDFALHVSSRKLVSDVDIERLAWSADGARLLYESRPGLTAARKAIATEGLSGFRFDERFWPLSSDIPMPPADVPLVARAVNPSSGAPESLQEADKVALHPDPDRPASSTALARLGNTMAWSAPSDDGLFSPMMLHVQVGPNELPCTYDACSGVTNLWWITHELLVFQRRAGIDGSLTQFYAWRPRRDRPRLLLATTDALFGCREGGEGIICAQETSVSPRHLVAVSARNGSRRVIFDPNPEYPAAEAGIVRRLEWANAAGVKTYGDLVLPRQYRGDRRLPLVIVQYESRGFLRGGTGDEYPIQALAAHGFAVLSFNRTPWLPEVDHPVGEDEYLRLSMEDFADRRNILSSLTSIIGQLDRDGVIDPARVAITGQSDGAVTATFALTNTRLFAAAILSTCCEDAAMLQQSAEGYEDFYVRMGYPANREAGREFWRIGSLAEADGTKPVPLLIQASSSEFRMGLATYRELMRRGWPIDMYVYPDEGHVKLHPAHRSAVYRRSLQWLDFWFNDRKSANPVDSPQYERWEALRHSVRVPGN